ncbi:hypothetical protein AB8U03_16140 [Clostridium sp. Mt-5]|uniref:Uncharacterized protein n=1 Tax=Clostridium moutaii TaxID=3240932 RepID=A0ABV4BSD8_9CLOT
MSGRPGTTRYDTNKLYLEDIAQKWGLVPTNPNVDLSKFDTGGENTKTGLQWLDGTPGKPEYVLNSEDTAKMYKAVDLIKDIDLDGITNRFNNIASSNLLDNIIIPKTPEVASNINNKSQPTQVVHQYHIDKLEFPSVIDGQDIVNALTSLDGTVKQYTSSYKYGNEI